MHSALVKMADVPNIEILLQANHNRENEKILFLLADCSTNSP